MTPPTGTVTRRAAKGIPPRIRSPPRAKHKSRPTGKQAAKDLKRHVSESDDDESEQSVSDDLGPKAKEKRHGKRQRTEVSEEDETIDVDAEAAPEEVDDVDAEQSDRDEEVSIDSQLY